MIITESFVWLNFPKTGSTFVRQSLRRLYTVRKWQFAKKTRFKERHMEEINVPNIRALNPLRSGKPTPHGQRRQIPNIYRHLPIVSALRDPVERLVSAYTYADWRKPEALYQDLASIQKRFPSFPDITFMEFADYMRLCFPEKALVVGGEKIPLGRQSLELLSFFRDVSEESQALLFSDWEDLADVVSEVIFLRTETLNADLLNLLLTFKFSPADVRFILHSGKVNQSRRSSDTDSIASELETRIRSEEWLLNSLYNGDHALDDQALQKAAGASAKTSKL